MKKYRATRSFHIGEIAKLKTGSQSDIREGEEIDFDGEFCVFRGKEYKTPGLKGAIELKWLVQTGEDYVEARIPVVRDEVSRPRKSTEKEPQVKFSGLTLKDYDFNAHWRSRQKQLMEIDDPEVLRKIYEKETEKFLPYIEKRIAELESQIESSSHKQIGAIGVENTDELFDAVAGEVWNSTEEEKSKTYQSPKGKKVRKPMKRDAMEEHEMKRPSAEPKEKKAKKSTKLRREVDNVEGEASAERKIDLGKKSSRANRTPKKPKVVKTSKKATNKKKIATHKKKTSKSKKK